MSNQFIDKRAREPFRNSIAKIAAMTIESETPEDIRQEIHRYVEAALPHLSPYIEEINFDNIDLGNGDIIGKVVCNYGGETIFMPLIVKDRVIQPLNVGAYGDKMIPMAEEYLDKIIEGKSDVAEMGVQKDPQTEDSPAVFRFEDEHELPTYNKVSELRKIAEHNRIVFGNYRDKIIFGDNLVPKHKLACMKVGSSNLPYHYKITALVKTAGGGYEIDQKDKVAADELEVLYKLPILRFGKIKEAEEIKKIQRNPDGSLPDGFMYLSDVIKGDYEPGEESNLTIHPYLEEQYMSRNKDDQKGYTYTAGMYNMKDVTANLFDDERLSAVHLRETEKKDLSNRDRLIFGFLTYRGKPEKRNENHPCIEPRMSMLAEDTKERKSYVTFIHADDNDNQYISTPYKIDGQYSVTLPTEDNKKVYVYKLRKYVTDTKYCFIEGMGNEDMKELSSSKLRQIGLYEGDQYRYFALPKKYGKQFYDSVEFVSDDISDQYLVGDLTQSENSGETKEHEKVATLVVTNDPHNGVDIRVKGAGYDEMIRRISKEAADLYLNYYTSGNLDMKTVKLGHEYHIMPETARATIKINNPHKGEWLKTAYWFNQNISKHAGIEELIDAMIGMEYLSDEVDSGNEIVADLLAQLPQIIDRVGRLLILSRLGRVEMSPAVMSKVFEALGDLHCEIK